MTVCYMHFGFDVRFVINCSVAVIVHCFLIKATFINKQLLCNFSIYFVCESRDLQSILNEVMPESHVKETPTNFFNNNL